MSRRMIVLAVTLAALVGGASSYAARLLPTFEPQPPEQPAPRGKVDRQGPPARHFMGQDAQITSSGKFVYLLWTDTIFQFDGTTLEFVKKVKLTPIDQFYQKPEKRIDGQAPRKDE